jgi:hypothetical protein
MKKYLEYLRTVFPNFPDPKTRTSNLDQNSRGLGICAFNKGS